jgi:hypothetical protein
MTTISSPPEVRAAVHSHFDNELTRATPPDLPIFPWKQPDNLDSFVIEPRGDPSLTLADVIALAKHSIKGSSRSALAKPPVHTAFPTK